MNRSTLLFVYLAASVTALAAEFRVPAGCDPSVMGEGYWKLWNAEAQKKIDRAIEANRKADAKFVLSGVKVGTTVTVEQVSHDFRFGAHTFCVGRLKTAEINRRYEENFAKLFNQATIAFYWRGFETSPGDLHFHTREGDLESAFTSGRREGMDAHSRYLSSPGASTDQAIEFAKHHDMIIHGHPLIWGNEAWMLPFWLYEQYCPEAEKDFLRLPVKDPQTITRLYAEDDWLEVYRARIKELYRQYDEKEIAARCPVFLANMKRLYAKRIEEIMDYCGDRVDSWDVVNESSYDWYYSSQRSSDNERPLTKSGYGIMPPNYVLQAFRTAAAHASKQTKLAINDYNTDGTMYHDQIADLLAHDARIDMIGMQFHIFSNDTFRELTNGWDYRGMSDPEGITRLFTRLGAFGHPVSISEITIPTLADTPEARQQQAIVAANLYRAWFAQPNCCGITWWHTLDGANEWGGEENGTAGLMDAEGRPKPSYQALYDLIHREWKTRLTVEVKEEGNVAGVVSFRGFTGTYRLSWVDADGNTQVETRVLKKTMSPKADWVNVGSSTGRFGFDWESAGVKGLNLASCPQTTPADFARLKANRDKIADGAVVIIPLSPFTAVVAPNYDEVHVSNDNPGELDFDGTPKENRLIGFRDLLNEIWKRDYGIANYGDPMNERCRANYAVNVARMKEMIAWCRAEGLKPVFVYPPSAKSFDEAFPPSFFKAYVYDFVRDVAGDTVPFYDYWMSPDFRTDNLFANALSLNKSGRRKFTAAVLSRVQQQELK